MGRIRTLPPHVVNQIAAGEVVDRPASVVKELVENALDAGATRIEVVLSDGGKARIEVRDDGSGMDAEDVRSAFLPHATSKLREVSDLEHVGSLGFRGEALASIGSVSRASITSRERGAAAGSTVEDREGTVSPVKPAGGAPGTVVVVEGLFSGVPARRKFLRSAGTELAHVAETVERFALAHADVVFLLAQDRRAVVSTEAGEGRLARIARFHGDDLAKALLHVGPTGDEPAVEAFVSPPGLSRADARLQQVWLNGRPIRDRTVAHALREAYRDLVPPGDRQPIAFVFLSLDPARVDVNVHPAKAEVRWRDSAGVHEAVRRAIRATLESARPGVPVPLGLPHEGVPSTTVAAAEFAFTRGVGAPAMAFQVHDGHGVHPSPTGSDPSPHACASDAVGGVPAGDSPAGLKPLAQALGTYLVLEADDGIVLVDQHALHERVLFDEISARLNREGALEVQHLLVPQVVDLGPAATARLSEEGDLLRSLGWEIEPFGEGSVAVRACPAVLKRPDPAAVLTEVLDLLDAGRREGLDRATLLSSVVDRMACRAAVMAGDRLHPDEVSSLLSRAEALNHSHSCPHGRPTRLTISRTDLERYFHR